MDDKLLETLSDGGYHSGEALGAALGISRAAVWKQLQKLESLGVRLESVKGRGYRIPGGLSLLRKDDILAAIEAPARKFLARVDVEAVVDSTNSHISRLGNAGHGVVCLAEQQTEGRGRRGRNWVSPYGKNLYLSMGWAFEGGASCLEGLSLAAGLAVRRALDTDRCDDKKLGLKWPNDVIYDNRKLAGILVEMTGDPNGRCHVVIGVGINHGMDKQDGEQIEQPWADAREVVAYDRNVMAGAVVTQLLCTVSTFEESGFASFLDEWFSVDASLGKAVTLTSPTRQFAGIARGVASNGAIRIEVDGRIREFSGGEISLRMNA